MKKSWGPLASMFLSEFFIGWPHHKNLFEMIQYFESNPSEIQVFENYMNKLDKKVGFDFKKTY